MSLEVHCPQCNSENVYPDGHMWVCPECGHEWNPTQQQSDKDELANKDDDVIRDANGNILQDGDTVTVIKDLKVKGSSSVVKSGTKVKNIRLVDGDDGHDIACKIDGLGSMNLKSQFVKKI